MLAVEVHKSSGAANDSLFSVELAATATPVDPATLLLPQLNEISAGNDANFRVEIYNPHATAIDLAGYQLAGTTLPTTIVAPGQYATFTRTQLGGPGDTSDGDELFLIAPDGRTLADAPRERSSAGA